jgi:hypothetical protein
MIIAHSSILKRKRNILMIKKIFLNIAGMPNSGAIYKLIFVLHKDVQLKGTAPFTHSLQ